MLWAAKVGSKGTRSPYVFVPLEWQATWDEGIVGSSALDRWQDSWNYCVEANVYSKARAKEPLTEGRRYGMYYQHITAVGSSTDSEVV